MTQSWKKFSAELPAGCVPNMSVTTLLHWHSLQDRRKYAKLTLFQNAIYHSTALEIPDYYMPMQSSTTRNFNHLQFIPHLTSTTSYQNSYFPSSIKLWSNLPNPLLDCSSHNQFLFSLFKYMFK